MQVSITANVVRSAIGIGTCIGIGYHRLVLQSVTAQGLVIGINHTQWYCIVVLSVTAQGKVVGINHSQCGMIWYQYWVSSLGIAKCHSTGAGCRYQSQPKWYDLVLVLVLVLILVLGIIAWYRKVSQHRSWLQVSITANVVWSGTSIGYHRLVLQSVTAQGLVVGINHSQN